MWGYTRWFYYVCLRGTTEDTITLSHVRGSEQLRRWRGCERKGKLNGFTHQRARRKHFLCPLGLEQESIRAAAPLDLTGRTQHRCRILRKQLGRVMPRIISWSGFAYLRDVKCVRWWGKRHVSVSDVCRHLVSGGGDAWAEAAENWVRIQGFSWTADARERDLASH